MGYLPHAPREHSVGKEAGLFLRPDKVGKTASLTLAPRCSSPWEEAFSGFESTVFSTDGTRLGRAKVEVYTALQVPEPQGQQVLLP